MKSFELLDVTLRDGGHLSDFHFTEDQLHRILSALDSAGLDYIEVGYRNGSISPIENIGIAGLSPNHYLNFCKERIQRSKMAVMAHCQNITKEDIHDLKKCGVSLLRLCIQKGEHPLAYPFIGYAKDAGMLVSTNIIHISQYSQELIQEVVESILPYAPTMIYFADSNGCLHMDTVSRIYQYCISHYNIPFGYHAHDNIGLAQANALAALTAGAQYIDASLAGASKGIGNLKLEYFIAYLHRMGVQKYDLKPIISASNYVRDFLPNCGYVSEDEFTRGIHDLSTKQLKEYLMAKDKGLK